MVGGNTTDAQSNVFYKGIQEFGIHGGNHAVPSGIAQPHVYTIDWRSDVLTWSIDGTPVRTLVKENSTSPMVFSIFWKHLYVDSSRRKMVPLDCISNSVRCLGWRCVSRQWYLQMVRWSHFMGRSNQIYGPI